MNKPVEWELSPNRKFAQSEGNGKTSVSLGKKYLPDQMARNWALFQKKALQNLARIDRTKVLRAALIDGDINPHRNLRTPLVEG